MPAYAIADTAILPAVRIPARRIVQIRALRPIDATSRAANQVLVDCALNESDAEAPGQRA